MFFKETGTALALRRRSKTEFCSAQGAAEQQNKHKGKENKQSSRKEQTEQEENRETKHRKELEHLKAQTPG
jgi:hypothetical protein